MLFKNVRGGRDDSDKSGNRGRIVLLLLTADGIAQDSALQSCLLLSVPRTAAGLLF